jgi:hypothetical protein
MKYVIFGDSFADKNFPKTTHDSHLRWFNSLDYPSETYGWIGSSIWYSIDKFFNYINSSSYDVSDRIIFITTYWGRAIRYTDNKFISDQYRIRYPVTDNPKTDWEKYHATNKLAHNYITENVITKSMVSNVIDMLKAYLKSLPNKTLLLPAYQLNNNEFNLLEVSRREFANPDEMEQVLASVTELRPNHLTYENHKILANMIVKYFKTQDTAVFSIDKFYKPNLSKETLLEQYSLNNK